MKAAEFPLPIVAFSLASVAFAQTTYTYTSVDYPGAGYTQLNGINSAGAIVGAYSTTELGNTVYSFLRSADSSFTQLFADTPSIATGISDSGVIVGSVDKIGFILSQSFTPVKSSKYLTYLNGVSTNNSIVGNFANGFGDNYGFKTVQGNLVQLPYYNEQPVVPRGINKTGTIVGTPTSSYDVGVILDPGGKYQIVKYPGALFETDLAAINDAGVSTGYEFSGTYAQGFTYNGAVFSDVIYPASAGTYPLGINSNGVIVGFYIDSGFLTHGFIATPIPQ